MDVVVTPTGSEGATWSLKDRLGRSLGTIEGLDHGAGFEIKPKANSGLRVALYFHATLNEAMTDIAEHMNGGGTLDSQDWD